MSIMNFLPWRQQRRARCLHFWGGMCVGTVLLMFAIIFCLRINPLMRLRALQTELTGTQTVQHALASRQKLASQAQKPAQTLQRRAWQPVLESLSRATPSQVWLTELRYQPPALTLSGYAITLSALSALRDALGQIAGFTPGTAGELRQDSQGWWMFTLHLKSEG
ncbi:TPA: PilN domain-containing protein [Enterobacter asburiae]|jgi:pilus assembly protein HofN|uniref:PilN domain-containing protein n=1 Tax=Enterobacter asburiae TaxID=61645 RepID=UPI000759D191|nr:PilN domain-containing protein [Enterobacter asburiae]SAG42851.1 DNA utilization protein HofN [Enterobacter cloacae]KVJ89571.1 pilus assembly protein HofN [Enterobacter asburiae]MDL4612078.1 PilN domain-containing protein [Enterobacter asburiae]HCM9128529.1 PilN domain-containing protein [Enterobacter asburiae]HDW1997883.1 PilN domain-containing protein [Enterobacter asburiae]